MKRITVWLLVALATFLIGVCAAAVWLYRHEAPPTPDKDEVQVKEPERVIAEVSSYYGGDYCYEGNLLELRAFSGGRAEFEGFGEESPCQPGSNRKPLLMSSDLTAEELKELIALSSQPDILKAKSEYPVLEIWTDTFKDENITIMSESGAKKIVLHNPEVAGPKATSNYPPSLIALLQKIEQIRKRLGEHHWNP
jgi:hypothetical protein